MLGIDTNILVRFLVDDDPEQSGCAAALFAVAESRSEPVFVSQIVLCECAWVLRRSYRFEKTRILDVMAALLQAGAVAVEGSEQVAWALEQARSNPGGLADYLIGAAAGVAGCTETLTFDRALAAHPSFRLLS